MIDGVVTRSQAPQMAFENRPAQPDTTHTPPWQLETDRLQSEISSLRADIAQMDLRMENRLTEVRTSIITELQKVIAIALGKVLPLEETVIPTQELVDMPITTQGVLGSTPNSQATSSNPQIRIPPIQVDDGAPTPVLQPPPVQSQSHTLQSNNRVYHLMCPKFDGTAPIFEDCGDLTKGLQGRLSTKSVVLDSSMMIGVVSSDAIQVFDKKFQRQDEKLKTTKYIVEFIERDDPYGFRLLLMEKANQTGEMIIRRMSSRTNPNEMSKNDSSIDTAKGVAPKRGMLLSFTPLAMSFDTVNYYVAMPLEMKAQGIAEDKLQLLQGVTGACRPGVLIALIRVSGGAGKTILMDVLAGRKIDGYTDGDIRISGYPNIQETFARISGYCEQNNIHSLQVTVRESLVYLAFLWLPKDVSKEEKMSFVDVVMELVELDNLKDTIVRLPGVTGLSTEQRKWLTIVVEFAVNPSIIFIDKPTFGLDTRVTAIVMRIVKNTVDTGRIIVYTINQPSIDIFEAFDEWLLMKRGGKVICSGPLSRNSHKIIEYFEFIPGIPKIKDKYNPTTWMLEVSSVAVKIKLGMDFAEHYNSSSLYPRNKALVNELRIPPPGTKDLYSTTQYSQSTWGQFKSCLWKQWWTCWSSPNYNLVRYFFTVISALMVDTIFWQVDAKRESTTDLTMIIGAMYAAVLFVDVKKLLLVYADVKKLLLVYASFSIKVRRACGHV